MLNDVLNYAHSFKINSLLKKSVESALLNAQNPKVLLDHISIVMVNTTLPANIGAAARAMKTMGLSKLVLVAPKTYPSDDATALAAGAADILDQAIVVETLEDAIADCELVFGTSARSRTIPWPLLEARAASELAIEQAASHQHKIAIVFGREDRGLTNEELALANYHLTIPVNDEYGVLNVAAAIQVVCYELRIHALGLAQQSTVAFEKATSEKPNSEKHSSTKTSSKKPESDNSADEEVSNSFTMSLTNAATMQWDEPLVTHAQMSQFYPHLETMLVDIDFMDPENPRMLPLRLKRLFGRIQLDRMEYNLLRGIFGRVQALTRGKLIPITHSEQTNSSSQTSAEQNALSERQQDNQPNV